MKGFALGLTLKQRRKATRLLRHCKPALNIVARFSPVHWKPINDMLIIIIPLLSSLLLSFYYYYYYYYYY